ncbi:zinc finger, CCHC-type containing protein [Tanacetum coccineum]
MTYRPLWLEGLPFELEWDLLPNYTIRSLNSFEWRKIIFGMITSMGIRHAKAYTFRGRPLTKLEQRSYSQTHVLHLYQGLPAKIEIVQVPPETLAAHAAWVKGKKEIVVLMLMTMELDLQWNLETLGAYDMLKELKTLFAQQAEHELLQTVREFHVCKQEEGQYVSSYVLKMKSYIDNLERLGQLVSLSLAVSLILVSLRKEYDSFVQNYNMHGMGKMVNELHAMLKLHEQTLPKRDAPALHAIRAGKVQKKNKNKKPQLAARGNNKEKGKSKLAYAPKPKIPPPPKKEDPAKDSVCHNCGIFTIELFTFPGKSWVYDTGCGTHTCNTTQGFRRSRKLKPGALSLYMGNGQRAAVEAIRSYDLCFPSGLVIVLHNCHYAPSITRGVILVSCLYDDGFINRFKNDNSISVSKNNLICFNVVLRDSIFEIVLSNSNTNDSFMYAVSNKRSKLNLDSSLLWHCRLGHISKKCIEKLQHDGLLNSIDTNQEFLDHLKEHGIIAHHTPPYTPQHNGVSERRNRILLDMVRSMMSQTTLPKSLWDYALESVVRILNTVPTKKVLVKRDTLTKLDKLEPNSIKCIFVGFPKETIEEDTRPSENTSSNHDEDNQEIDEPQSDIIPICSSIRTRHAPDQMCLNIEADKYELGDLNEPANYKAALSDPEFDEWLKAMNVEMKSMKENKVWDLVDLPPNKKTICSKWLFKKKTDMDRAVHTYKARLVAKGFTQTLGIDYKETFSSIVDIRAIRILIAIAAFYDYEIWQMDVKNCLPQWTSL